MLPLCVRGEENEDVLGERVGGGEGGGWMVRLMLWGIRFDSKGEAGVSPSDV